MTGYYAVLGVPVTASMEEVRSAYRRQALLHHPDHGGSAETFYVVLEAHHVLSDPGRRADYDQDLALRRVRRQQHRRDESLTRERSRREAASDRATTREFAAVPQGWGMEGRLATQRVAPAPRQTAATAPRESGVDLALRFAISMLWGSTAGMVLVIVFVVSASVLVD